MATSTENSPSFYSHNEMLARLFHQMALCYRYLGEEERFRAQAYEKASRTLSGLKEDISGYAKDISTLDQLSGIGESIAEKILEFLQTGKIRTFEKLKKKVPEELLPLLEVNGIGPATLRYFHEKMGISNRDEMEEALRSGQFDHTKGFGSKKLENIKRALKMHKETQSRMNLWEALKAGERVLEELQKMKGIKQAVLCGSLRRRKETIGDIDVVVTAAKKDWKPIIQFFVNMRDVGKILASGDTKASILLAQSDIQVDLRVVLEEEYGAALLYFTGSKEHNIQLRTLARAKGWKLNEYGIFDLKSNHRIAGNTEADMYKDLGMDYIPPELRECRGELELARNHSLPKLIEQKEMKGDMHLHSTWSDGAADIGVIAAHIQSVYPNYEYIVVSDHSPSEKIARGLQPDEFLRQFEEIDKINRELGSPLLKKGIEVDILADGHLDVGEDLLAQFDWVTASIHSGFTRDNTKRLRKACENRFVHCIGHPGGRLIGKRAGYPVNWAELFKIAMDTGTALEINSQPLRLDLTDELVKAAIEAGVTLTISTDAHALSQFSYMQLGIAVARRGFAEKSDVLNTLSWKQIESFKKKKLKKLGLP